MSDSRQKNASLLKKAIWIILPVVIIAVVLVAVFAGQSDSLSDQIAQLEHDKADLSRKLNEADIAVRTARELAETERNSLNEQLEAADARAVEAENRVQEAETKVQAAEAQAQEAASALSDMTTARDQLQAENTQMTDGIRQVQSALSTLISDDTAAQLQEAKEALAAVTGERDELQSALAEVESERDELKNTVAAAVAQAAELQTAQEALAALTEERDGLKAAAENARIETAKVVIRDAEGNTVQELDDVNALDLVNLSAGEYTVTVTIYTAAGDEAARYSFRYTAD